jgi:hypothetical protein
MPACDVVDLPPTPIEILASSDYCTGRTGVWFLERWLLARPPRLRYGLCNALRRHGRHSRGLRVANSRTTITQHHFPLALFMRAVRDYTWQSSYIPDAVARPCVLRILDSCCQPSSLRPVFLFFRNLYLIILIRVSFSQGSRQAVFVPPCRMIFRLVCLDAVTLAAWKAK